MSCEVAIIRAVRIPRLRIWMQHWYMSRIVRKPDFAYAKTKAQTSFAVTAKLISAFVFATRIVQFLFFLNPKFQASSPLYRPVCVRPGRKSRRPVFSRRGSIIKSEVIHTHITQSTKLCARLFGLIKIVTNAKSFVCTVTIRVGVVTVCAIGRYRST